MDWWRFAKILNCFIKIFADDTKVYTAVQSDECRRLLQNSVDQLVFFSTQIQ